MIQAHEQLDGGEEFLGFARQKLAWLHSARLAANLPVMSWGPYPVGSAEIFIVASESGNTIRITDSPMGFLFHPRVGPLIAVDPAYPSDRPFMVDGRGFLPAGTVIPGASLRYPLVDDDHGTRLLTMESDDWTYETAPTGENYGNIDWIGPGGEILTWKGPPSRMFGLDYHESIPGLTEYAGSSGAFDYFTPFTGNVYSQGLVLDTVPQDGAPRRILGAALITANKYLIVIASGDYTDVTNPDSGTGGFYDEAWLKGAEGWQRLWYRTSSRPTTCWFFNASGNQAINAVRQVLSIDDEFVCTLAEPSETGTGTYSQSKSGETGGDIDDSWAENSYVFSRDGDWPFLSDFKGDAIVTARLSVSGADDTYTRVENKTLFGEVELWYPGSPSITAIVGTDTPTVGTGYSIEGNVHNVVFTSDKGVMTPGGVFTNLDGVCGAIVITATACGASLSRTVRGPVGVWVSVYSALLNGVFDSYCPTVTNQITSGEYQITTVWGARSPVSTGPNVPGCTMILLPDGWGYNCYTSIVWPEYVNSGGYPYAPLPAHCSLQTGFVSRAMVIFHFRRGGAKVICHPLGQLYLPV